MFRWPRFFLIAVALLGLAFAFWLWTPDKSRTELEARYLAAPSDMVEVDGTRLHVRDSGPRNAHAILMLHGMGAHLQTWDGWTAVLEKEFRVIRLDLPGSGLSPPDPHSDYSDARSVALLSALMDKLGVPTAAVVGNSMGGRIAWTFAAKHPERVSKLVLVSPDGFASPGFIYGKAAEAPMLMHAMKYVLPKFMLRDNLAIAYADSAKLSQMTLDRYFDLMLAPGARAALLQRMQTTVLQQPEPLLQRIACPVLLLWGEKDAMIPFANSADYLANLKNARLVPLPGLGHLPQEEDPAGSVVPIQAFLAGN